MRNKIYILLAISIILTALEPAAGAHELLKYPREGSPPVTVLNTPGSDICYIMISFRTGSARDPEGRAGLNFITAKLLEEGIRNNLDRGLPQSGAEHYVTLDREVTTFYFKVHRRMFEKAYPLIISPLVHPAVEESAISRARSAASNERERVINHGETLSLTALELFIYRDHPYSAPVFGTAKSVTSISPGEVKEFFSTWYTRENYVLGTAGYHADHIRRRVEKDLAGLPSGSPDMPAIPPPREIPGKKLMLVRTTSDTTSVALGFPLDFTRSDDDYYPLLIANASFGQHRYLHGLLFRQLRVIRGFNYGDYSYIEKFAESGQDKMPAVRIPRSRQYFYIWIRNLPDENACFALKFALYSLEQMVEQGLPPERFSLMRDFMANNSLLWDFDPFQILGFSMDSDFYHTPYYISLIGDRMKKITGDDVSAALKRRLSRKDMRIVMVTHAPELLKEQLLGRKECVPLYRTTLGEEDRLTDSRVLQYDLKLREEDIELKTPEDLF